MAKTTNFWRTTEPHHSMVVEKEQKYRTTFRKNLRRTVENVKTRDPGIEATPTRDRRDDFIRSR